MAVLCVGQRWNSPSAISVGRLEGSVPRGGQFVAILSMVVELSTKKLVNYGFAGKPYAYGEGNPAVGAKMPSRCRPLGVYLWASGFQSGDSRML
jgi:hypothetical protein